MIVEEFLGAYVSGATNTTYNFTDCDFGEPSEGRYIRVEAFGYTSVGGRTIDSCVIGGVNATRVVGVDSVDGPVAIFIALVPEGESGTVSITFNSGVGRAAIGTFLMEGINNIAAVDIDTSVADPGAGLLDVPAGGLVVGISGAHRGAASGLEVDAWSGVDENYDEIAEATSTMGSLSGGSRIVGEADNNYDIGISWIGNSENPWSCFAVWAPVPGEQIISGVVQLDDELVSGATVRLFDMTANVYVDSVVSDENGAFLFEDLSESNEYHVFVEFEDTEGDYGEAGLKYNARSLWAIEPVEE